MVPAEPRSHRVRHASQENISHPRRNSLTLWREKVADAVQIMSPRCVPPASRASRVAANIEKLPIYPFPRSLSAPLTFPDLQSPDLVLSHPIDNRPPVGQRRTSSLRSFTKHPYVTTYSSNPTVHQALSCLSFLFLLVREGVSLYASIKSDGLIVIYHGENRLGVSH